ncbi:MAG: indolepyruvate oxidoreductase subunit beta [Dehalococcoidales bacterium]|nr:indolepyruvate oxidoreductase subunit beta [Dehalococcoidales bacterium]
MKTLTKDPFNIIIAGVGGQGNVVLSQLIGNALVNEGYLVTIGETYGASQRGGPVMSHMRISKEIVYSPLIEEGTADIILGMEPSETLRMLGRFGNPAVKTIVNPRPIYSVDVAGGEAEYPDFDKLLEAIRGLSAKTWIVNATEEAEKMGSPIVANTILVGALVGSGTIPLDRKSMEPVLEDRFPKALALNLKAFDRGMALINQ